MRCMVGLRGPRPGGSLRRRIFTKALAASSGKSLPTKHGMQSQLAKSGCRKQRTGISEWHAQSASHLLPARSSIIDQSFGVFQNYGQDLVVAVPWTMDHHRFIGNLDADKREIGLPGSLSGQVPKGFYLVAFVAQHRFVISLVHVRPHQYPSH